LLLSIFAAFVARADDPWFGPWYGSEPLPVTNRLTATAGADGLQDWPYLIGWNVGTVEDGTGIVTVPVAKGAKPAPVTLSTEVVAAKDTELWTGVICSGKATLTFNDQSVAGKVILDGPDLVETTTLYRLAFHKGANKLAVRLEPGQHALEFGVRVCVRGKPSDRTPIVSPRHLPPNVQGFRRDGTGAFPDAKPVTAWDWEKGINIAWTTPLLWTKSSPLVVGDKVFTQMEPHFLVCVDRRTGKMLWQRETNPLELTDKTAYEQSCKVRDAWQESGEVAKHTAYVQCTEGSKSVISSFVAMTRKSFRKLPVSVIRWGCNRKQNSARPQPSAIGSMP
jgi:hypothetical protein